MERKPEPSAGQRNYEAFYGDLRHKPWNELKEHQRNRWERAAIASYNYLSLVTTSVKPV